jgi:uncharacterized membrane protein YfcA
MFPTRLSPVMGSAVPTAVVGMVWTTVAGALAGFVLGFLGVGGAVVALPVLLLLAGLGPHRTLGTNALAVFLLAGCLFLWRARQQWLPWKPGLVFAGCGGPAIFLGAHLGLLYPGRKLIFLVGVMLFAIAGWMTYLSCHQPARALGDGEHSSATGAPGSMRVRWMVPVAFGVGLIAGFFGVGGGFLIVPALMLVGGLELGWAAAVGLLPIAVFAGIIGVEYWVAGDIRPLWSVVMLAAGIPAGAWGIWLSRRLSKVVMLRAFAVFLVALGGYIGWPGFSRLFRW